MSVTGTVPVGGRPEMCPGIPGQSQLQVRYQAKYGEMLKRASKYLFSRNLFLVVVILTVYCFMNLLFKKKSNI